MNKWVKIVYTYTRGFEKGSSYQLIRTEELSFKKVKGLVKDWCQSFSGLGLVRVECVLTGPFLDDELTEEQQNYFYDRVYSFNN